MNRADFWKEAITHFAEYMKARGYKDSYIRTQVMALKRILREFGDLGEVTDQDIWERYSHRSKYLRKNMQQALRAFKKWLEGEY